MKARYFITQAALALMPIFGIPGRGCREAWEMIGIWLACLIISFWIKSCWRRIFLWLALLQVILHPAAIAYKQLAFIILMLGAAEIYARIDSDKLMDLICVSGLALIVWMFLEWIGLMPIRNSCDIPAGLFNPNAAGVYLSLCLPAFWRGKKAKGIPLWILSGPILIALFLPKCTTALIALLGGIIIYALLFIGDLRKKLLVILSLVILAGLFFKIADPIGNTLTEPRWLVWRHVIQTYRAAPWGRGLGSFGETFHYFVASDQRLIALEEIKKKDDVIYVRAHQSWIQAHNEYLQVVYEMGWQTGMLIMIYIILQAAKVIKNRNKMNQVECLRIMALTILAVSCAGFFTLHIIPLGIVSMAWLGMKTGENK